jgi:hypothetical protein
VVKESMRKAIDILLLAAWLAAFMPLMISAVKSSEIRAQRLATEREAIQLHEAFRSFYQRYGEYPNAYAGSGFDRQTLDPLRRRGYYEGPLVRRLLNRSIDAYDSPDDRGVNQEYWLEMTLAAEPTVRFVVACSDNAPLGKGAKLDGAYILRNGRLEPL